MKTYFLFVYFLLIGLVVQAQEWYVMPKGTHTHWSSFENPNGVKGNGGKENKSAKGHPSDNIQPGQTVTLLEVSGAGTINRIWLTINNRSPQTLRSIRFNMYWDERSKPAVSVPLGDFFGVGLGMRKPFESALFSDPEGKSFNCIIPMPYKKGAKVTITNESQNEITLFYDIDFISVATHRDDVLYFHAWWNRELKTKIGVDYTVLPNLEGSGRFLGMNMGINAHESYKESWWGEGEIKMYLDGDSKYPTIIGTGTEDYVGSAWGQGEFNHAYQGSLIVDDKGKSYAFYRYHIPDPVYFHENIRVTMQQIGGWGKDKVLELIESGADLKPVTLSSGSGFFKLLETQQSITDPKLPNDGWVNFYRSDDVSSTAYFYLDKPENNLPELAALELRTASLKPEKNEKPN